MNGGRAKKSGGPGESEPRPGLSPGAARCSLQERAARIVRFARALGKLP